MRGRRVHLVDPADLIELVGAGKQRVQAGDLEEHAAGSPLVHFWSVVAVRQEALRCSVPSRRDVLCVGLVFTRDGGERDVATITPQFWRLQRVLAAAARSRGIASRRQGYRRYSTSTRGCDVEPQRKGCKHKPVLSHHKKNQYKMAPKKMNVRITRRRQHFKPTFVQWLNLNTHEGDGHH